MEIRGKGRLEGEIKIPGDKSISHRSVIFASISQGESIIDNILLSEDTRRTIEAFRSMGISIDINEERNQLRIEGKGLYGLKSPQGPLDCGNSGTTMRLLAGLLSGQDFATSLIGDDSLTRRPMDRIIVPLRKMGADISAEQGQVPPLGIKPVDSIRNIEYELPVASAQVKSAILLASLYGRGESKIIENRVSRDHTERMLEAFRERDFQGHNIYVAGDISSAAFLMVAASIIEGSSLVIRDVGINPTRTGIIDVLMDMGARIKLANKRMINNEPMADIYVESSRLKASSIDSDIMGRLIDEIPILAVAAAFAEGETLIRGAEELKYKETNRIKAMAKELARMGVDIKTLDDGLIIRGGGTLHANNFRSYGDHRIAMALSIAALNLEGKSKIEDSQCINISFPNFYDKLFEIWNKL